MDRCVVFKLHFYIEKLILNNYRYSIGAIIHYQSCPFFNYQNKSVFLQYSVFVSAPITFLDTCSFGARIARFPFLKLGQTYLIELKRTCCWVLSTKHSFKNRHGNRLDDATGSLSYWSNHWVIGRTAWLDWNKSDDSVVQLGL